MSQGKSQLLERFEKLSIWRRYEERAPHKPLLLLLALGRLGQNCPRLAGYREFEQPLRRLLQQYGPPRHTVHPEYPFWRLQADGLWEVKVEGVLKQRKGNSDPLKSELIAENPPAGFPSAVFSQLRNSRGLFERAVLLLLNSHFPDSMHEDLLRDVGIDLSIKQNRRRDLNFVAGVLKAYGNVCAICGYDVRVGSGVLGIEAAHIKWFQAGGPDEIDNGLALCTIHHKALDYGALRITPEHSILLSCDLHGQAIELWFMPFHGKNLRRPNRAEWLPNRKYIQWHENQVFRAPARDLPQTP